MLICKTALFAADLHQSGFYASFLKETHRLTTESPNHSPGCIVLPHPNKTGRGSILSITLSSNVIIYLFCLNLCLAIKYHIPAHTDIIHQPCKCYTIFSCIYITTAIPKFYTSACFPDFIFKAIYINRTIYCF